MEFKGAAKRIDDIDLPRIAHRVGAGEDELHALIEVETSGKSFDSQGRSRILFEPHVFYRNLSGAKRDAAVKAGLAYPKQGTKPYGKESAQYPKLERAMKIDATAALKACSWGGPQILGENHEMIGYKTVQEMVEDFKADEENQINAMVNFIIASGLADDLNRIAKLKRPSTAADWAPIARTYNGPKYDMHDYDGRLAKSHNKWKKIPDTPWQPDTMTKYEIEAFQRQLQDALYTEVGNIDGKWGSRTIAATSAFQSDNGLPVTGEMNPETRAYILAHGAPKRHIAPERANATVASLEAAGTLPAAAAEAQKTVRLSWWQGLGGGAATLAWGVWEYVSPAWSAIAPYREDIGAVAPWLVTVVVIGLAFLMHQNSKKTVAAAVEAVRKGQDTGV